MQSHYSHTSLLSCLSASLLAFTALEAAEVDTASHSEVRSANSLASAKVQRPCPTCDDALGIEAFRQTVGGEAIAVMVELQDPPGVMSKMAAERTGRSVSFADLTANSAALVGRQRAFIASLPRHGVRALLREKKVRQVDGSIRHVSYQLTYLLNGFVLFVPPEDVAHLRAVPGVRAVSIIPPTQLHLDKGIDYTLGLQTNVAARRSAVYGATQEFQPAPVSGHQEAPATTRIDGFEGQNINIAVIDSGVDWRHPMFGGIGPLTPLPRTSGQPESTNDNRKVIYYYALSSPGDPTDDFGHGTLVASCAAGYAVDGLTTPRTGYGLGANGTGVGPTPNGVQLHGTAPQARILAYKVCGPANNCLGDIELAIEDAASPFTLVGAGDGNTTNTFVPKPVADVINLSLGNDGGDPAGPTSRVVNNAALAGSIVVTSAGNNGPGAGTLGAPAAATLAIAVGASFDPGSIAVGDVLSSNSIPGDLRLPGLGGPSAETGPVSDANSPQVGERQGMKLFVTAGGGALPGGSISAHYVFVDRNNPTNTVPPAVQNRIALVKGSGTFAQIANAVAPFNPAAILIITSVESATALVVVNGIPTYTISPDHGNYLIDRMLTGDPGDGNNAVDVPVGTISELPLRLTESQALSAFQPGMAGFSSRGPTDHASARHRIVKPDVTAPGVGILGAATPDGTLEATLGLANPSGYVQANGTSFSCPITAGGMALVRQRLRDLGLDSTNTSALHYRSTRFDVVTIARALLMNSASNLRSGLGAPQGNGTNSVATINDFGAGHINLDGALHHTAIMISPTILLADADGNGASEFVPPAGDPPPSEDYDAEGNLKVFIPSASFGVVPIVGVNATLSRTQQVIIRDITAGAGGGVYTLSFQNNRHADEPGFQIAFLSAAGEPTNSVTVPASGQATFLVKATLTGNLVTVDPTEFQWFITATQDSTGQSLRMPLFYRAVAPTIPNITAPDQLAILADQPEGTNTCGLDTNSTYQVRWTYTAPSSGPAPVGFRVQEGTYSTQLFFDNANEVLVANANSKWAGGTDWNTAVNPNSGSAAYYVPDTANQDQSLTMVNSVVVPAGGATLSFLTTQDFEDGFDQGFVEVSTDNGTTFTTVAAFVDNFVGTRIIDISPYSGNAVKIRFRAVTDLLNGDQDPAPLGWFIEDIRITSDNFQTIAQTGASATSSEVRGRPNGTFYYRVAGLFASQLGVAPGPYSENRCINLNIGVPLIARISMLANQHALLDCLGQAGLAHRIQAGTNFTDWTVLGSRTASTNGTFQFEDNASPGFPFQFYRLVTP